MKLETFVNQRRDSWYRLRELVRRYQSAQNLPDDELSEMVHLYRSTCSDYAHAQSAYPYDRIVTELNQLIGHAHNTIYGTRIFLWKNFFQYFVSAVPSLFRKHVRLFTVAISLFGAGLLLSFFGSFLNGELPRHFLGDQYVEFTTDQINRHDPFAIYKQENSPAMSSFIMTNNVKVTFIAFAMGIFAGFGTVYILFYNGMLLGVFLYLFYSHDLLQDALLTIMMHGTIELTCVFISGMAGLLIGKSLLLPGSYTRTESLRINGLEAVQLVLGCIPLLIIAGIIEGFITRLDLATELKFVFILCNVIFLIWYFGLSGRRKDILP